jgi:hypothetical protein
VEILYSFKHAIQFNKLYKTLGYYHATCSGVRHSEGVELLTHSRGICAHMPRGRPGHLAIRSFAIAARAFHHRVIFLRRSDPPHNGTCELSVG